VPHHDYDGEVVNTNALAIGVITRALAARVDALPSQGTFAPLVEPVGTFGAATNMALRVAAKPLEPDLRFLELKTFNKAGTEWRARWIKQGSTAQLATFLRHPRAPLDMLGHSADMLEKLASEPG
jgi:hypothetical protein